MLIVYFESQVRLLTTLMVIYNNALRSQFDQVLNPGEKACDFNAIVEQRPNAFNQARSTADDQIRRVMDRRRYSYMFYDPSFTYNQYYENRTRQKIDLEANGWLQQVSPRIEAKIASLPRFNEKELFTEDMRFWENNYQLAIDWELYRIFIGSILPQVLQQIDIEKNKVLIGENLQLAQSMLSLANELIRVLKTPKVLTSYTSRQREDWIRKKIDGYYLIFCEVFDKLNAIVELLSFPDLFAKEFFVPIFPEDIISYELDHYNYDLIKTRPRRSHTDPIFFVPSQQTPPAPIENTHEVTEASEAKKDLAEDVVTLAAVNRGFWGKLISRLGGGRSRTVSGGSEVRVVGSASTVTLASMAQSDRGTPLLGFFRPAEINATSSQDLAANNPQEYKPN